MTAWEDLLEVQRHDTTADQLEHRSRTLPERAERESLVAVAAQVDGELAVVDEQRGEIFRAQKRLEDEIASLSEKADTAEAKLYSGSIKVPKELQALQDDVEHIRSRVRRLEDDELELMEQDEPLDAERGRLVGRRAEIDAEVQRLSAAIAEAETEIAAERKQVQAERDRAAASLSAEVLDEYESLRARLGGIAVARLNGASCGGCHLQLSAVEVDRIRSLDPAVTVHCEECGRLLVRG